MSFSFQNLDSHRITVKTTIVQGHHNVIVVEKTNIPLLENKTLNKAELVLRLSKTRGFDTLNNFKFLRQLKRSL